ncbi:tRNA pseudouridine(55) synthase TruB [Candidatus Neptunichlamydia sp. REUL1]|uniref:tRNA pseudouridine(55) synthase TruB n=1 Tax=Candidatus Neptunichlamydia sp. REUL1 TaxID=3064277 RepID=UPI0029312882|nr:tRNA pseudouridine(55) synthase TruB [Candidatus Neptunochlamydia sp. REUL1]
MSDPKSEGVLLVDKEKGRTAFYLVKVLRKISGIKKIGHAGILDPFATGVMVMLIGRPYTRISDSFLNDDKEYIATIKFGESTDTFDCDGTLMETSDKIPTIAEIESVVAEFQGSIMQIPPMFSAKKVGGQKLYLLARKGIEIKRKPVQIEVKITTLDYSYPELKIKVSCSKGTYIRSIASEIGEKLGCFGHLIALQRTRSGSFHLKDCIDAKSLSEPSFSYIPHLRKTV